MSDRDTHIGGAPSRREFVGGVTSLLAAASFSLPVSAERAAPVTSGDDSATQTVESPDGSISVTVDASDGDLGYRVVREGTTLVEDSSLGFAFRNQPAFGEGVTVTGSERSETDTTWEPVWDRYDEIREHYRELRLGLAESDDPGRQGTLELRVFDDGLGFRFVFGESFGGFVVTSERTEFGFADDYRAWWIPNDYNNFENEYEETPLSEVGDRIDEVFGGNFSGVHTPITMEAADCYLSVHEADLTDYASLALAPASDGATTFEAELAPLPDGTKVSAEAPHMTPWRTIQVGDSPGDLVESNLVVNLNEDYDPEVFTQGTDWIEPQKYVGIWWLMITGRAQWEYTGMQSGNHGAQTGRAKQYMDFASEHGFEGVLVEGWNEGWQGYPQDGSGFDYDQSYPDFDLEEVTDYGPSLDPATQMTMHNETAGDFLNYESQLEEAYGLYDDLGIRTIKTGYVADSGNLAGEGHNHHNQVLVNHHTLVAETAAANRQMLDIHEPIHPTGRRRKYPNLMTREGVKGQEYDSFGTISPEHHVTFPFTRMLGGPVEFTPGIFDMDSGSGGIETTRAKQLAMFPTYFSGLQMAADLPSSYLADRPAETAVDEVLQAEFADIDGFPTKARWANAQGEQYVPIDPNRAATGSTLTFTVEDVPSAGEYDLHLRYASDAENNAVPADTDRTATVTVNGSDATQVTAPPTDYWDTWDSVSVTVSLEAGDNEVGLTLGENDTGGFNLDSVAVTDPGASMPTPDEAPIRGETVDAFQFVEDVPADWDDTEVLDAEIGDYMVTARQQGEEWYLGAMTDEGGKAIDVDCSFLSPAYHAKERAAERRAEAEAEAERARERAEERGEEARENSPGKSGQAPGQSGESPGRGDDPPGRGEGRGNGNGRGPGNGNGRGPGNGNGRGKGRGNGRADPPGRGRGSDGDRDGAIDIPADGPKYVAEIYSDGIDASYPTNLTDVRVDEAIVTPGTTLLASMVGSGGTAVRFRPADGQDLAELPEYERPEQDVDVEIASETFFREPFVSATGSNDGDFVGGRTVELYVDGEFQRTENVRFPPNTADASFTSAFTIDEPGTYDVRVASTDGETLASETVEVKPPATVATRSDPTGDDNGPGGYTYPTADAFPEGVFDLTGFEVAQSPSVGQFTFEVETLNNAFGSGRGFSPHMFVLWLRDPNKSGGRTTSLDDLGANVTFEKPWHYRLQVSGFTLGAVDAGGAALTDADGNTVSPAVDVDSDAGTVTLSLDREAFDGVDLADLEAIPMVQSEDFGSLRSVAESAGGYTFGGAKAGAVDNAPLIMDLFTPAGVSQADALAYDADSKATLPFVSLD